MKILIVCDHFYPEEFIINDLANEWSNNGHEVTVLTQNPSYPKGKVYEGYKNRLFQVTYWNKVKIHRVYTVQGYRESKKRKILNYLCFVILGTIKAIIIAKKIDKIFIYQVGHLTQAIPAIIAHKLFKLKIAIWTTDIWPDTVYAYGFKKGKTLSFFLEKLVKTIYANCNSILIPSPGFNQAIKPYVDGRELILAPNWCMEYDIEKNSHSISLSDRINFTFAGNIGKVQNLENVILGFEKALLLNSDMTLNIIGDGSFLDDLKKLVQQRDIHNIIFWGRQPASEMYKYYEASDFLIISLDPDPVYDLYIPTKFQTYLQTGKPILGIMNGQVSALISQYDIGIVATPDSIEDIAEKMIQCTLMSKEKLKSIKMNSKKLLENNFDRLKIIKTITNALIKG